MESVCGFIPNYLKTTSFFVDGETHNRKESMIFLALSKCSRLCKNFYAGTYIRIHIRLLAKFEFSAR